MKKEYDLSKGVRGEFHNPDGEFDLPIYLDREIADYVEKLPVEAKSSILCFEMT